MDLTIYFERILGKILNTENLLRLMMRLVDMKCRQDMNTFEGGRMEAMWLCYKSRNRVFGNKVDNRVHCTLTEGAVQKLISKISLLKL